jgi:predicted HAD superfamily hydrolase
MSREFGDDFPAARIEAEREARRISSASEISLECIYDVLGRMLDMSHERLQKALLTECELERRLCVRREDMLRVMNARRAAGDRVIGISDMYLSGEFVQSILDGLGIHLDELYVSSDELATKHVGDLFERVAELEGYSRSDWTHYGDNEHSDVAIPLSLGINAVHCPIVQSPIHDDPDLVSGLVASVVRGVERTVSYADEAVGERDRIWHGIGTRHTGPIAVALCGLAKAAADRTGASHIFFLARDGHIMKRVYETIYPSDGRRLVYLAASRRMINFPLRCSETPDYGFLSASSVGLTISQLLGRIGVDAIGDSDHVVLSEEEAVQTLRRYEREIVECARLERDQLRGYLTKIGMTDAMDAVIVDVGWFCSIQKSLQDYLSATGCGTKLHGVYIGTNVSTDTVNAEGLFFTGRTPSKPSSIVNSTLEVMELLFTSDEDSIVSVREVDDGFDIIRHSVSGEGTRHVAAGLIRSGAVAFAQHVRSAGLTDLFSTPEARNALIDDYRNLVGKPSISLARCASAIQHCVGMGGADRRPLVATGLCWRKPFSLIDSYQSSFWPAATAKLLGLAERRLVSSPVRRLVRLGKRLPSPLRRLLRRLSRRISAF